MQLMLLFDTLQNMHRTSLLNSGLSFNYTSTVKPRHKTSPNTGQIKDVVSPTIPSISAAFAYRVITAVVQPLKLQTTASGIMTRALK